MSGSTAIGGGVPTIPTPGQDSYQLPLSAIQIPYYSQTLMVRAAFLLRHLIALALVRG